jgi:hypothetical protein
VSSDYLSRRSVILQSALAVSWRGLGERAMAQESYSAFNGELSVAKEFNDAFLRAVSPEGSRICLYFTHRPNVAFTFRRKAETLDRRGDHIAVIESGSWKTVYSGPVSSVWGSAGFFPGTDSLYLETLVSIPGGATTKRLIVDIRSGGRTEFTLKDRAENLHLDFNFLPLTGKTLLGVGSATAPFRYSTLVVATLPDFEEAARVWFAVPPGTDPDGYETFPAVAGDRKKLFYAFGRVLVCRQTEDLALLWTRTIDNNLLNGQILAVSADGMRLAASFMGTETKGPERTPFIEIYDGRDGSLVRRLAENGDQGMALSPTGRWLAVAKSIRKSDAIHLLIDMYDAMSGQLIASAVHDRVPPGRLQSLNGQFHNSNSLQFTSDGKYLLSSANNLVKVWQV